MAAMLLFGIAAHSQDARWTQQRAGAWYSQQPWLVGANYIPSTAINQLEMWQAESFDPQRIDIELGWAEGIGMNTMRVFLHDLLWQQDPQAFEKRIDTFLTIAAKHKIRPMFVLFDSCWDPDPRLGEQREPRAGIHNSGWVQSPGAKALRDRHQYPRLEAYVKGVIGAFHDDPRVLAWDLWNEPDNMNTPAYRKREPRRKVALVSKLLPMVFAWARSANPSQPLTSGVWKGNWGSLASLSRMQRIQLESSDVISFHSYQDAAHFRARVASLEWLHRPILCTEYMARGVGSTFQGTLPVARELRVAAFNWGLVLGKTQTNLPWDSWKKPYIDREPSVWFHDIFYPDGRPYREDEVEFIRHMTGLR